MRILWNELKKILTWKMLLLLAVVNSILFFLFIEFYIEYFPNGRPGLDNYNISIEVLEKYGMEIDEEEFVDFKETYATEVKKVDDYLQTRKEFIDSGLLSYEDLRNYKADDEEVDALIWGLYEGEIGDTIWELQSREYFIELYKSDETTLDRWLDGEKSVSQQERIDELKKTGQLPVFPDVALDNFKAFIVNVAIAIIFSVVIIISPVFIKDRLGQILAMQYTTKKGRSLYKKKVAAGFISTFLVITILLGIYFSLYTLNNTSMFFDIPIHKFGSSFHWYDPTFFQYIILTVIAIYILGFATAFFAMSFSSIVPNYISLIGIQIPYVFLIIALGINYLVNWIISISLPKWLLPVSYSGLVVAGILFIVLMWKREQKRDIML